MRGYHTTSRKSYPVKTHRKLIRSVRGKFRYKYKSSSERTNSISVTLKDLGDIDVKELNTIPSSIVDEEVLSWIDVPDMKAESATCPNPLLQVNSGKFCPMCTADLVKICGNDTPSSLTCSHMEQNEDEVLAKARSFFEKNMIQLWNSLDENMTEGKELQQITSSKNKNEIIRSKKGESRKLFARGLPPENEITCSMSKLSMQAYLCTSESTISAVISEAVQTPPSLFVWSSSSDEKLFGQSAEGGKLKLLCGELLLQLCKATAGSTMKRQAPDQTDSTLNANFVEGNKMVPTSTSTPDGNVDQNDTAVTQKLPDWLKEITGVKSQPGIHQKYDFAPQGNIEALKLKAPSKSFKPLLCTKLSVPWRGRKHSTQQHALYLKTQPKMNYPDYNCTVTKSVSSLIQMNSFNSDLPDVGPTKIDAVVPERNNLRPKKDPPKKKKEFKESEVCPKCKTSMRSDHHNNPITIKTKQNKGRRGKGRSVKRNRRISKERHAKRRISSRTHRGAKTKTSDTKYFIKSFFTGTSSETTPKTKSHEKTSRNLSIKPNTRRKKSTFTLPHSVTVGQAGFNFSKKKPDEEIDIRQLPGKVRSKNDVETLMNKELKMITKHVKAHEKHIHQTNAPMFHTCFKNILSHELKNKGVHGKKPVPQKESFHPRKPRGNNAGVPQKIEKRKFNDSLFSCLIPRVFK